MGGGPPASYRRSERGKWEQRLIGRFGSDGVDVLGKLAGIDDNIVERLCQAICAGRLGDREVEAARLAAAQAGMVRRR